MVVVDRGLRPPRPKDSTIFEQGLDDALWALVEKCWSQEPHSRPIAADVAVQLGSMPSVHARELPAMGDRGQSGYAIPRPSHIASPGPSASPHPISTSLHERARAPEIAEVIPFEENKLEPFAHLPASSDPSPLSEQQATEPQTIMVPLTSESNFSDQDRLHIVSQDVPEPPKENPTAPIVILSPAASSATRENESGLLSARKVKYIPQAPIPHRVGVSDGQQKGNFHTMASSLQFITLTADVQAISREPPSLRAPREDPVSQMPPNTGPSVASATLSSINRVRKIFRKRVPGSSQAI